MSGSSRRCGTCRWFKDAGMGGTGWCTHPKRQTSSDVRILVRKAELACRNAWGEDYWESLESTDSNEPIAPAREPEPADIEETSIHISFEDEVTSVVDADIHRAHSREDLNDRVVDESNLDPDDNDDNDAIDDRFGLLARGGRDSVSEARNRMLRRRGGDLDLPDDDAPGASSADKPDHVRFAPDDFVEEEGPAHEKEPPSTEISPFDDVVLSENVPQGSPRSRRFRREREGKSHPKARAVAGTIPDVPAPAKAQEPADQAIGDPFNTVPKITSEIDISKLRRQEHRATDEARFDHQARTEPPREDAFEQAIRSAHAIRAAARTEREGRQRQDRRTQIMPRMAEPATEPSDDASATVAQLAQSALARQQAAEPAPASPEPAPRRSRMSTREFDDAPATFDEPQPAVQTYEDPAPAHQHDPRTSWWRGVFLQRQKPDEREREFVDDGSDYIDDERFDFVDNQVDHPIDEYWLEEPEHQIESQRADDELTTAAAYEVDSPDDVFDDEHDMPAPDVEYDPVDLEAESGMESFRSRLFGHTRPVTAPVESPRQQQPALAADELLDTPSDAWYEPEPVPEFDVRRIIENAPTLLDMTIEISPDVPRQCATCRSYRQSEQGARGWCTNNWAFTHRQMVNATDLACDSTIGCWWLPADEEVWLDDREPERVRTPRVDRLIAHLDPLKKAVGR